MSTQVEKYEEDFKNLQELGKNLELSMNIDCFPSETKDQIKAALKKKLLHLSKNYQISDQFINLGIVKVKHC